MNVWVLAPRTAEKRTLLMGIAVILYAVLIGCVGATPLPRRTRTATGAEVKSIETSFIHPGQTTHAEVKDRLKVIDTGYEGDHYFLGRWSSSTWGGWIIVAGMCCEANGGGGRVWRTGNLLVEFDDVGIVKRVDLFSDRKMLQALSSVSANTPLQLDPPRELQLMYWGDRAAPISAKMILSAINLAIQPTDDFQQRDRNKVEAKKGKQKHPTRFSVPAKDLLNLEMPYAQGEDLTHVGVRIRCAHDLGELGGPHGKNLNLQVSIPQIVTLMSYITQVGSGEAK